MSFDYVSLSTKKVRERKKDSHMWIDLGVRNSANVQKMLKELNTESNVKVAEILVNLLCLKADNKIKFVEVKE